MKIARPVTALAGLAGTFAVVALLGACSSTPTLSKSEVETQAAAALTAQVGQQSPPITCPSDLEAKVGATMVCSTQLDSATYDVTVTITAVEGTNASFDVKVADKPRA